MPRKTLEFEIRTGPDEQYDWDCIELECEWSYRFYPGKYSGRYEDCYPDECDSEIYPVGDWEQELINRNPSLGRENIDIVNEELDKFDLSEWAAEEAESYAADKADWLYEQAKDLLYEEKCNGSHQK